MPPAPAAATRDPPPMLTPLTSMISGIGGARTCLPYHGRRGRMPRRELVPITRVHESGEQRVRLERLALELRGELHRDGPRGRRQLDDLDELSVERAAAEL